MSEKNKTTESEVVFVPRVNTGKGVEQSGKQYVYKIDYATPVEANDYAIRYCPEDYPKGYAKIKGGEEFETDFIVNNHAYDVYLGGNEMTKEEYERF